MLRWERCRVREAILLRAEVRSAARELPPQETSSLPALRLEINDEELELIEMRYQQWLSIMDLETLFMEGEIDGLWSDRW